MPDIEYLQEELAAMEALSKLAHKYLELKCNQCARSTVSDCDMIHARAVVRTEATKRRAENKDA